MGKRKSAKPPPKRVQEKLATIFTCPFCNHAKSVECNMDRKKQIGEASCRICHERFRTSIDALSEPIDVYSDWIDECERANSNAPPPKRGQEKLATVFTCPFCHHENSVECNMDRKKQIGEALCRICQESFRTFIDALSDPIDVYSDWINECERVNSNA